MICQVQEETARMMLVDEPALRRCPENPSFTTGCRDNRWNAVSFVRQ
jgi:hypothetical protein